MRISTQIVKEQSAPSPEVVDFTHQLAGCFYDLPALGAQILWQRSKQFLGVSLCHSQIPNGPAQQIEVLQQVVQHIVHQ